MLKKLKKEILESTIPESMPIKFIAVDGHGGSGKSTLANILANELDAEIIHTDDFASFDNPMDWWQRLVDDVFEPIQKGKKTLSYNRGAWYKNHQPKPVINQSVSEIMILEGVSSSREEFRKYLSYSIWVETPKEICMSRGISRDLSNNPAGRSKEEIKQYWERWHRYEDEYVASDKPQINANKIVDGTIDIHG